MQQRLCHYFDPPIFLKETRQLRQILPVRVFHGKGACRQEQGSGRNSRIKRLTGPDGFQQDPVTFGYFRQIINSDHICISRDTHCKRGCKNHFSHKNSFILGSIWRQTVRPDSYTAFIFAGFISTRPISRGLSGAITNALPAAA